MRDRPTKDHRPSRPSGRAPDRGDTRTKVARPRGEASPRTSPVAAKPASKFAAKPRFAHKKAPKGHAVKEEPFHAHDAEAGREESGGAQRIAKVMARAGLCSRRTAETWIGGGRVALNGAPVTDPAVNVSAADKITVDGEPLARRVRTRLFLFHKPSGLVSTECDPEGRPTIFDYLREHWPEGPRVVSIGRLDINTEGLLLLTNDGGLARILELPSTGWVRRYRVRAKGETDQSVLDGLREGVTVEGVNYAGIEATLDREQGANSWLTLALREGKNREIKRVLEHFGLMVNRLIRLSFGPFQLGELAEGAVEEVRTRVLRDQLGPSLAKAAGVDFSSPPAEEAPELQERIEDRRQTRPRPGGSTDRERGEARRPRETTGSREKRAPAPEARGKPDARPRKHISALRAEDNTGQSRARGPDRERGEARRPRETTGRQEKRAPAPEARSKPDARPRKHISALRAEDSAGPSGARGPDRERGEARRPRETTGRQEKRAPAPEARSKPDARPRKHISALRAEDSAAQTGGRKRIERRETADRSGRTVQVERLVPAETGRVRQDKLRPPATRNSRRFEAERKSRDGEIARPARRGASPASRPTSAAEGAPERKRARFEKPGAQGAREPAPKRFDAGSRSARPTGKTEGGRARTHGPTAGGKPSGKGGAVRGSGPGKGRPRDKR